MKPPDRTPLRLTFLTVMPSPYMRDQFEATAADPRFRLRVKYMEREAVAAPGVYWRDRPLPDYATVLAGRWCRVWGARVHVNPGVVAAIRSDRPDVVVVAGYNALSSQLAMWWLSLARVPWIFWGELPGLERRGRVARAFRWLAQRPAVRLPSAVAAIGARAATAYRQMAPAHLPVWNIPYSCNLDPFRTGRRGAGDGLRFLYCGQLIRRKGVDLLVRAFVRVAAEYPHTTLTLVGAGPLREELARTIPGWLGQRVHFAGFREVEHLPDFFAGADVFVLPSRHDGWGLVVNQAIGAGRAVIASSAVGAAEDLVRNGENGLVFPCGDEDALVDAMRAFARNPEQAGQYGVRSLERVGRITTACATDRWYELCRFVADRCPRTPPADRLSL